MNPTNPTNIARFKSLPSGRTKTVRNISYRLTSRGDFLQFTAGEFPFGFLEWLLLDDPFRLLGKDVHLSLRVENETHVHAIPHLSAEGIPAHQTIFDIVFTLNKDRDGVNRVIQEKATEGGGTQ